MELGSGRLVAQEAYRDVTRTFTGALFRWRRAGRGAITAFAVLPVLTLPDDRESLLDNRIQPDREHLNSRFWGTLYERPEFWLGMRGETYVFRLDEHDVGGKRETRDRAIWTGGGRVFRGSVAQRYDLDVEAAGQVGHAHSSSEPTDERALDVAAWYVHASTGYTWSRSWAPRLGVEFDYGSGDTSPIDGQWNRFDTLFGNRRVGLGPTSIYGALGRENIDTVGVRLSAAPTSRFDAFAVYRWVGLAGASDVFASTGLHDPSGRAGRDGGRQLDLRVRAWLVPRLVRLEAGVTHLTPDVSCVRRPTRCIKAIRPSSTVTSRTPSAAGSSSEVPEPSPASPCLRTIVGCRIRAPTRLRFSRRIVGRREGTTTAETIKLFICS